MEFIFIADKLLHKNAGLVKSKVFRTWPTGTYALRYGRQESRVKGQKSRFFFDFGLLTAPAKKYDTQL
ncbi:MAG: hypothetical protein ACFKPT_16285 [Gloeotrichia echinulata GP01]